jgi:hypothetical protein
MIFHSVYSVQCPFFVSISDIQPSLEGGEELFGYPPIATLHWGLLIFRPAVWGYNASILFSEYMQTCGLRGCIYFTWKFAKE